MTINKIRSEKGLSLFLGSLLALGMLASCTQNSDESVVPKKSEAEKEVVVSKAEPVPTPKEEVKKKPERKDITTALNEFLDKGFEERVLARSPETLTALGRDARKGEWDDASDAAIVENFRLFEEAVDELDEKFPLDTLSGQARLSHQLLDFQFAQTQRNFPYRDYAYPFNQMFGRQSTAPAFLINQHRVHKLEDARAYISRLQGFQPMMDQYLDRAIAQKEKGIAPPEFVYAHVLRDSKNIITGAPFDESGEDSTLWADFQKKVAGLELEDTQKQALLDQARNALLESVKPAYERVISVMEAHQEAATTDDGVWKLPQGGAYYGVLLQQMTTTDKSADEIHQVGLEEVERIHDEMRAIMEQVGFDGDLRDFFEFTRNDDQFFYPNTDEGRKKYSDQAESYVEQMKLALDDAFNVKPKADLVVKRVEPFREKSAGKAFYQRPSEDGSRPRNLLCQSLFHARHADLPAGSAGLSRRHSRSSYADCDSAGT